MSIPTAGGLYFWAYRLGGHQWAWVTAWFNMIGQVTITAGINYAAAAYAVATLNRIFAADLPTDTYATVLAMIVIMIPQVLINVLGIKLTAKLSDFSVVAHRRRVRHRRAAARAGEAPPAARVSLHHGRDRAPNRSGTVVCRRPVHHRFDHAASTRHAGVVHARRHSPRVRAGIVAGAAFMAMYWFADARHRFRARQ